MTDPNFEANWLSRQKYFMGNVTKTTYLENFFRHQEAQTTISPVEFLLGVCHAMVVVP